MNTERKLVTVREVADLQPIPGADAIEVATVDGWKCVVKKDIFSIGDLALYFEIDSILPSNVPQFDFLTKGTKPHRLKTIRLRKQLSQGLLMPIWDFPDHDTEADDLAAVLGVIKYDPELPPQMRGKALGNFPTFIRKTDQERIQNMVQDVFIHRASNLYEVTEKLDGSSLTLFNNGERTGVCSRNLELDVEGSPDNTMVLVYKKYKEALEMIPGLAIQGEIVGPGIQGNKYNLTEHQFFVFDVFNIETQTYLLPYERHHFLHNYTMFDGVPIVGKNVSPIQYDEVLKAADGDSLLCPGIAREGVVWKANTQEFSFKVISNAWLEKNE